MDFVKSFGFTNVDHAVLLKLNIIVEVIIFNILNNVLHVTKALDVKTIKKGHFNGVMKILQDAAQRCTNKQSGGEVFPSEFFGHDSGRYFDHVDFHNTAYIDNLSRGPLLIQAAGAVINEIVSIDEIKTIVNKYKKELNVSFKVALDVYPVIQASVASNMKKLLSDCSNEGKNKKLTLSLIKKNMSKELSHVWK